MEKKETSITGYVGKNPQYKFYEESKKSTLGFTIKEAGIKGKWYHARAYNAQAEKLKAAIDQGIDKLTISGNTWKDVSYDSKKNPGKKVSFQELQVNDLIKHRIIELAGNIGKIENKTTTNGKAFKEILVIQDQVVSEGKSEKNLFNVTIWEDKLKAVPSDVKLEVGAPLAVKGEASILENKEGSKEYVAVQAWNVDRTPEKLTAQIEAKQEKAALSKQAKATKKENSKGQGRSM